MRGTPRLLRIQSLEGQGKEVVVFSKKPGATGPGYRAGASLKTFVASTARRPPVR